MYQVDTQQSWNTKEANVYNDVPVFLLNGYQNQLFENPFQRFKTGSRRLPIRFFPPKILLGYRRDFCINGNYTLCISYALGTEGSFQIWSKLESRYNLTNLYTFYIGPYERFVLEASPAQISRMRPYKIRISLWGLIYSIRRPISFKLERSHASMPSGHEIKRTLLPGAHNPKGRSVKLVHVCWFHLLSNSIFPTLLIW